MAVDRLQEKIRKMKNPTMLEFCLGKGELPPQLLEESVHAAQGYERLCLELLEQMKGVIPAVRFSFASFALLGPEGLTALSKVMKKAGAMGYYVALDCPELLRPDMAAYAAEMIFGQESAYPCDGVILSGYLGSDLIKPFLPWCADGKKDLFAVVRTGNKSASELQDLLAGGRVLHVAAADHVNRYGADTVGKFGYSRVGILAAASAADSLKNLRSKYPRLFLLVDGYDYPNANAKNCANAFDKFGHGAVVSSGRAITCAWKEKETDGSDYLEQAQAAAERMKKNLTRYVTIL